MSTIQYSDSVIDVHQSNIKANLEEPIEQKKFINLEITRRTLKYKILRQIKKGFDLGFYELSVKPLYIKAWHLYCSFFIMQSEMRKCNYTDESRLELENIFWKDHKSLLFYGAPYSWLVISDEDKFENWTSELDPKALEIQTKRLPQDIHYGLILKHYLPLSAVCNYTAGFNIEEYQAELPERDFERTKELALEYVSLNMRDPTMTIDRVRDIVSDVDMRF